MENNIPLISIIVPVYNVEKYLETCIQSIMNQDADFELILVNDGSTDGSPEICDLYANQHSNIKVIHKKNGGLSDARNVGIKSARGRYILFIDSDDFIAKDSLNNIVGTLDEDSNVDVILLEAVKYYSDGKMEPLDDRYKRAFIYNKKHEDVLEHISNLHKFPGSACTKLVKRSLILDNQLFFIKGVLSEDIDWSIRLFLVSRSFNYCPYIFYYYRQNREGSITNTYNINNALSLLFIIKKWARNSNQPWINDYQNYINSFISYEYIVLLSVIGYLSNAEKKYILLEVKEYSWLIQKSKSCRIRIIYYIFRLIGIKSTSSLLNLYLRFR